MSTGKQSTTDQSNATTEMDQGNANRSTDTDKTCVVCFKIVDIFSIGECDHPVCYECSTSNFQFEYFVCCALSKFKWFGCFDLFPSYAEPNRNACIV